MAITKTEVTTSLKPEIPYWLPPEIREEALEEVGRYVATEIALIVGDGNSPVEGYGSFKRLTEDYANEEKGGDRSPNLELEGEMMRALDWRVEMDEIKIGFFDKEQAIKAYGHNTGMKGHPWLDGVAPVRRIIPDKGENFNKDILSGVGDIIDSYIEAYQEEREEIEEAVGNESTASRTNSDSIDWLSGDDDDWW